MDIRDKAIITLLAKTGIRRKEPIALDISDVDFVEQKIKLKPTAKRTNRDLNDQPNLLNSLIICQSLLYRSIVALGRRVQDWIAPQKYPQ
jgi:integrase